MNSIGERLREERVRRGFDLQQVSELTKINVNLLEFIEADDLESLPGIFFTRSFVRQYAKALGLDEAEFESELNRLAACERVPTQEGKHLSPEDMEMPPVAGPGRQLKAQRPLGSLAAFLLILAACSAIYMLWQRTHEFNPTAATQSVPATPPNSSPAEAARPAESMQPTAAPPTTVTAASPEPASAQPAATPATAPMPQPATQPGATEIAPIQVQIRATELVWIRIAVDGKYLFSGTMQANETRTVGANQLLQLRTGNAAALDVQWNGKPVGPIGPVGQVRNVEFTPGGFRVLTPSPPKPEPPDDGF